MSVAVKTKYTPADLLRLPDSNRYELVDGELVEHFMSMRAAYIAGLIIRILGTFCDARKLGLVFGEGTTYQCFPHAPTKVRKPDVSFIRIARLTTELTEDEGHVPIAPDLAVEVVSPHDTAYEVDEKVEEYLKAEVPLVWVVYPESRTVLVHRPDRTVTKLLETDEITGEDVIPGFKCPVRDLLRYPAF